MKPTELEAQLEQLHSESYGWALTCCGWDESEAEDVLQTAYLKVVSGRARFGGRSAFKTWFFGVVRRTAQESYRRARSHERRPGHLALGEDPAVLPPDLEGRLERSDKCRRLLSAMEELSDRQQEVLHLVFYQDLSIAEAAQVMGVSLGSARTHYERAKGHLRALLQEDSPSERSKERP
jgi:RNA polymerase sigma-70 factor (ECF subfamily)